MGCSTSSGTCCSHSPSSNHIAKPYSHDSMTPECNMPKYELEAANSARLMALNNSDKNLATFLSATETVGLDEDKTCQDPIRLAFTFTMVHQLRNVPNSYQTSVAVRCHLPKTCTWPSKERSKMGALSLKTLGEYAAPQEGHLQLSSAQGGDHDQAQD